MPAKTKQFTALLSLLILGMCISTGEPVLRIVHVAALGATSTPTASIFQNMASIASVIAEVMEVLSFMIFAFLQHFLDPGFIFGFTETAGLQKLWQYSRDIMNILFAFMLLFTGIFVIITGKKEVIAERYKKFILAVILVNFSWFFPRVILDVANVLTATIYQLPAALSEGGTVQCKLPEKKQGVSGDDCKMIIDVQFFTGCDNVDPNKGWVTNFPIVCYQLVPWDGETNTAFGILNGLVVNYGRLGDLTRVLNPAQAANAGPNAAGRFQEFLIFTIHIIFILVLMMMLFLPLAAMFVVFLLRIPIIWVTIAFMPFMFLGFIMGDKMGSFDTMAIFKKFVTAAFLPTAIAVPFAAGFLILTQITAIDCKTALPLSAQGLCNNTGPLIHNVNTLWGLLMLLISFIIIWMGFWAALSIDDIYVKATAGIKSFGETVGKTAFKLPLSAPIIPIGNGTSILGLDDAVRRINASLSAGQGPLASLGAGAGGGGSGNNANAGGGKSLRDALNDKNGVIPKILTDIESELKTADGADGSVKNGKITRLEIQTHLNDAGNFDRLKKNLEGSGVDTTGLTAKDIVDQIYANQSQFQGVTLQP